MERECVCVCVCVCEWPSPLLSIHQVTRLCHLLTWSLLSLLRGTTFSLPPLLTPRWRHASVCAWQIAQLGFQPTNSTSTRRRCSSSRGRLAHSKTFNTVDNSTVSPSQSVKNLGVTLDNSLLFSANSKAVTRSCRFMLYNIRRVHPYLTQEAAQVLLQAIVISRLDYCNSLLAGLPACAIKPLQLTQNAAPRLLFNLSKFSHVTPLLRTLHWLPVETRIHCKAMVLGYRAARGTAPPFRLCSNPPYVLRSATSGLFALPPLWEGRFGAAQSKLFSVLAPKLWNQCSEFWMTDMPKVNCLLLRPRMICK